MVISGYTTKHWAMTNEDLLHFEILNRWVYVGAKFRSNQPRNHSVNPLIFQRFIKMSQTILQCTIKLNRKSKTTSWGRGMLWPCFYWQKFPSQFKKHIGKSIRYYQEDITMLDTAWKVSIFRVFLVCIFPHSDWIRRISLSPHSVWKQENTNQKNSEYEHLLRSDK